MLNTVDVSRPVTLRLVRLNRSGYDSAGSYWGSGMPLFWVSGEDASGREVSDHIRAADRAAAKDMVRSMVPGARFAR